MLVAQRNTSFQVNVAQGKEVRGQGGSQNMEMAKKFDNWFAICNLSYIHGFNLADVNIRKPTS